MSTVTIRSTGQPIRRPLSGSFPSLNKVVPMSRTYSASRPVVNSFNKPVEGRKRSEREVATMKALVYTSITPNKFAEVVTGFVAGMRVESLYDHEIGKFGTRGACESGGPAVTMSPVICTVDKSFDWENDRSARAIRNNARASMLIVDIRSRTDYLRSHIIGSINQAAEVFAREERQFHEALLSPPSVRSRQTVYVVGSDLKQLDKVATVIFNKGFNHVVVLSCPVESFLAKYTSLSESSPDGASSNNVTRPSSSHSSRSVFK